MERVRIVIIEDRTYIFILRKAANMIDIKVIDKCGTLKNVSSISFAQIDGVSSL